MLDIEISKNNGNIDIEFNDNFSSSQLDIALKDICIQLKVLKGNHEKYEEKENGKLKITVSRRKTEVSAIEDAYISRRQLPFNDVNIDSIGFGFSEIQHVFHNLKEQLPKEFTSRFMYDVNFLTLEIA